MKRVLSLFLMFALMISMTPPASMAQSAGNITSQTQVYSPLPVTIVATCVTTACPTFILGGGLCTATLTVSGATTVNVVVKVSNNGGTSYFQIVPLVVGVAANGTITTNAIAANGFYSMGLATMNRVRLEVGTLTGASVTFKLVSSGNCISQAL